MGCQVDLQVIFSYVFEPLSARLVNVTSSGIQADGYEVSLQPLPLPPQSQWLQRKPGNAEYLLQSPLVGSAGAVGGIGSVSLPYTFLSLLCPGSIFPSSLLCSQQPFVLGTIPFFSLLCLT